MLKRWRAGDRGGTQGRGRLLVWSEWGAPLTLDPPDIFEFWSAVPPGANIHPADEAVFARVHDHGFDLKLLPGCFMGPLRSAPIVLLFLSPGRGDDDQQKPDLLDWHTRTRNGLEPLVSASVHAGAHRWWTERTALFGKPHELVNKVAILNIGAYHSKNFKDHGLLAALPSSRVSLSWAQTTLFPAAERGERVVVCLRAARYWGLEAGRNDYAGTLFAPNVTRGGHMHKSERTPILSAVQRALSASG